ncbi:MAG: type I-U CRISPR-associated RAMP protein Csb1/Cas7u [Chloroflexi bacterium]|nr:type I-U CRISPR-associated RAMP protein Csb1/Cas7u [Chloroflexota bacterium]
MTELLTLDVLKQAVSGTAAAFRRVVELQPAGGPGSKVYPPTYEGGRYATEKRRINGETLDCVLLDSVQSQANRMELALQDAWERKRLSLPVISVDFSETDARFIGKITSLQAPHRIADAILRDSELNGIPFRKTAVGKLLDEVNIQNSIVLFKHCPTALVYGMWDSTGLRGGMGAKFGRAVVSEIIGIGAVPGQKTSSRIDPLQIAIKAGPVYKTASGDWTLNEKEAETDENGKPILVGKKGKPSEINHGNVTPSFAFVKERDRPVLDKEGNPIPIGGFTIDRAIQQTTISLPAIRRLKFRTQDNEDSIRTALVALALCGAVLSSEQGYDLRSQCLLIPQDEILWGLIGEPGNNPQTYTVNAEQALTVVKAAIADLPETQRWDEQELVLRPKSDLVQLVIRSYVTGAETDEVEES